MALPPRLRRTTATGIACLALLAACTGTRPSPIIAGAPSASPGAPGASPSPSVPGSVTTAGAPAGPGESSGGTTTGGSGTGTSGGSTTTTGGSGSSTGVSPTGGSTSTSGDATSTSGTSTSTSGTDTSGTATSTGGTTTGTSGGSTTGGTTSGSSTSGSSGGSSGGSTGGSSSGGSTTTGSSTSGGEPPPEANLYNDDEKYIGITDDRIHFCGHAALIFAEAFDVRPQDLNVYWQQVNEAGGVFGREVTMSWKDDGYDPARAVQGAEACRSENPFMLLGGIGFDQIPAVRTWAEANRMLYLHHIAIAPDKTYNYSYSAQPTVDATGTAFGQHIATNYGDKDVGIVWRQSENWEPGRRLGKEVLDAEGVNVVADLPVQRNQGVYTQQIYELQASGAEVVWVWENALGAAEIIAQAENAGYHPERWVVFPFQTTLDTTGLVPIDGVATWSAYTQGGYDGAFAEHGYDEEIERFEAAYAKYRSGIKTNDILWQVWNGNKALHDLLIRCGEDCNRNRMAGLFLSGLQTHVEPNCAADFAHPNSFGGHVGGHNFLLLEGYQEQPATPRDPGARFRTIRWCSPDLW